MDVFKHFFYSCALYVEWSYKQADHSSKESYQLCMLVMRKFPNGNRPEGIIRQGRRQMFIIHNILVLIFKINFQIKEMIWLDMQ
jgi:hypothetical protein